VPPWSLSLLGAALCWGGLTSAGAPPRGRRAVSAGPSAPARGPARHQDRRARRGVGPRAAARLHRRGPGPRPRIPPRSSSSLTGSSSRCGSRATATGRCPTTRPWSSTVGAATRSGPTRGVLARRGRDGARVPLVVNPRGGRRPRASLTRRPRARRRTTTRRLLNGDASNFFGDAIQSGTTTEMLALAHVADPGTAVLRLGLQGVTAGRHVVSVSMGGAPLGTCALSGQELATCVLPLPAITEARTPSALLDGARARPSRCWPRCRSSISTPTSRQRPPRAHRAPEDARHGRRLLVPRGPRGRRQRSRGARRARHRDGWRGRRVVGQLRRARR